MDYVFAPAADKLKPSAIREILKLSSAPGIIPLSAGNPAPEAFPVDAVREITRQLLAEDPIKMLQYSVTEGVPELKEMLRAQLKNDGLMSENDEILITCGAQQVMSLAATAMAGYGDVILSEEPSFVGSLNALKLSGARVMGIPMQDDGLDVEKLEETLKTEKNVKLLYVIPNFQNPTGITTSWAKREAIYALAKKYGILIIEDNPYGELYFGEKPPKAIKTMDRDGQVIYAGSFSKVLAPGIRVGYCVAPKELIAKFTAIKQTQDVHTNVLAQWVACTFLKNYDFSAHLEKLRAIYTKKAALCLAEMDKNLAPDIRFTRPAGGLFTWCTLPDDVDMLAFVQKAIKEYSVAVVPGTAFSVVEGTVSHAFRINYSTPTDQQLIDGMAKLGEAFRAFR